MDAWTGAETKPVVSPIFSPFFDFLSDDDEGLGGGADVLA
jgi:hypothetical protein